MKKRKIKSTGTDATGKPEDRTTIVIDDTNRTVIDTERSTVNDRKDPSLVLVAQDNNKKEDNLRGATMNYLQLEALMEQQAGGVMYKHDEADYMVPDPFNAATSSAAYSSYPSMKQSAGLAYWKGNVCWRGLITAASLLQYAAEDCSS